MSDDNEKLVNRILDAFRQSGGDPASDTLKQELGVILSEAAPNADSLTLIPAESKHITILLSDIRGFTAITETYSARTVVDMLNRYFTCMSRIIVRYGGTIDKFMGDSIMVLFGAPITHKDDVERAIACAVEMQQAMTEFNRQNAQLGLPEIFVGIGINSGGVMAGTLGSELHSEYTVVGDEVNLVSRIEAQSLRGQILLSESTYRLAESFVKVSTPNKVQVKGKRRSVTLYELLATNLPRPLQVPRRESRNSPRVLVKIPVFFQLLEGKKILPEVHRGEVVDLSYNGMQALVSVPLPPSSEICISMSLHLLGDESTEIYTRIVKVAEEQESYRASMEFTYIKPEGQQAIKQYVDSMVF